MAHTIAAEEHAAPEDVDAIRAGLDAFNAARAPDVHFRPLTVTLRDEGCALVGGLLGATYWGWLYVEILWLDEAARGAGHGSALLRRAEDEARARGCHSAHLDTMDWQALPFYLKRGYRVWGQLEGFGGAHTRYFLRRELEPYVAAGSDASSGCVAQ